MGISNSKTLNYVIVKPRSPITVDLFEAERYEPAIIVQSLIGNLVYYSNQGRYEPRLAKKWARTAANVWEFILHPDLVAENGEVIDATSFKASLERSLKALSKDYPVPILSQLNGYPEFISEKTSTLNGIQADGLKLKLEFNSSVRDGVLQVISFAPFGYISAANLNSDGTWKDKTSFVSSGPYSLKKINIGEVYILKRRPNWKLPFASGAPDEIHFTMEIPNLLDATKNYIVDSFMTTIDLPAGLSQLPLVPEYLNAINLGGDYFADLRTRRAFKNLLAKHRAELPPKIGPHTVSKDFYPNQVFERDVMAEPAPLPKPSKPLVIEGQEPEADSARGIAWKVLKGALEEAGLPYVFAGNETTFKSIGNRQFDIRLRGASIGGGAEAWGLKMTFCSELGPKFADPGNEICNLIEQHENEKIDDLQFARLFSKVVDREAAVIPITHHGIQLYVSPSIVRTSLNPTLSIIRFDMMELE